MGNTPSTSQLDNSENISLIDTNLKNLPIEHSSGKDNKSDILSSNITTIPESMKNMLTVDLSNYSMGPSFPINVAKELASYENMQKLELVQNHLEDLNEFENSKVVSINLLQNRFHELPDQFFDKFPNLNSISFDSNFLKSLRNQSSDSLVKLTMSLNCIDFIDSTTLFFSKLTFLDLSKNQISKLPNSISKSFPNLQDLNLSDNFIRKIPENQGDEEVFPKSLKVLNLSNNLIENIPNSVTCLPNLINLIIDNNQLTTIPQLNSSIRKFKASNNKISKITEQELNSLKELCLNYNKLTSFPTEIKMPKVTSLLLNHNKIKDFNFDTTLYKKITTIDISFNQIESIQKEIFENLPNLHAFYAFFNKISEIPSEVGNCKSLFTLDLSYNPIRKLPKLPKSLDRISASNCQIDTLEEDFFVDSNANIFLRHVDFSGNKIESFPNIESIQILNLSQNCIKKFPLITENLRLLDVSMNQIESIPQVISGVSITEINLSYNKLTEIPQFKEVPLLQNIELSGNPINGSLDLSDFDFLERVDISHTDISVVGMNTTFKEIITSNNDGKIHESSIMKRPVYLNQSDDRSGYAEMLGLRNKMEDSIIIRDDLNLYAICDGHSGSDTSKFASIRISELFEEKMAQDLYKYDTAKNFVFDIFNQAKEELKEMNLTDGSTLCLSFLCKNDKGNKKIVTANLGDSRALIVRSDGKSRELTKDHKPFMRSEFERVHNEFGKLSHDNRVDGILAVARSLGDFRVHGIGKTPDLEEFEIDENDKYLVIGCDGVFDALSNDDVAKVAMNASSTTEAAFVIRNAAFSSLSGDNISVIVVDLSKCVFN